MSKEDTVAIRMAAAKALAWDVYAAGGYGRTRARVNVKHFDRTLRSSLRQWNALNHNLKPRKGA